MSYLTHFTLLSSDIFHLDKILIFYQHFMINKGAESLPNKDAQTYKQLAKYYDAKNYKKGLKNADKLLETHPDHPETNSLKALFLLALGEEAKALDSAKLGLLKSKMKSMFCWHTCGTIYKQKKDFLEAAKCFQNALRIEPDNVQVMRETAALQIQIRDHTNHTATRFAILKQKPNMIQNWVGFTLAHHLRGDFPSLFKALVSLDNLIKTTELKPTELAHYYLYRVIAFRDAERWEGMYEQLKKNKAQIKDEVLYHELLHQACIKLDKSAEAEEALEVLLHKFPENLEYLKQYQELNRMSSREAFVKAQKEFKSKIARILQLCHIEDPEEFKSNFSEFIKPYYVKNLISLYTEIQAVYEAGKGKLIEEVFLKFESSLEKQTYPDGTELLSPSEYLWSLYLLAQHYSYSFETLPKAYDYIQKAIAHTCTVPEFYLVKADIEYKRHNNFNSLKTINQARKTDLADRYMNNICVKYIMRCEKPELGETVLRLFMRDQASLYELQNHWYIIQAAKSFLKQRNFEAGLRHLEFISKHFIDFQGNEYDFHTYCLRKWTLREYTELIEFNDNIYDDKKYAEAAGWALRYLKEYVYKIQEDELKEKEKAEEETKEEKEGKKKKKKKKAAENVVEENPLDAFRKKIDYFGKDYSERIKKSPLDEALNYAKCVSTIKYTNKGNAVENKLFGRAFNEAIDIFIHFKKPLLVLRLLNKLKRTEYCPFSLHFSILKAVVYFDQCLQDPKTNDITREFIKEFLDSTLQGNSLGKYNEEQTNSWATKVDSKLQYLVEIKKLEAAIVLKGSDRSELIGLFLKELNSITSQETINFQQLPLVFYLTHQLEFYGKLTEQHKTLLHTKASTHTSYFSDWRSQIPKLPQSTWTMWWLSDYDIQRQQQQQKQQQQRQKKQKQSKK